MISRFRLFSVKKDADAILALADSLRGAFVERGKVTKLEMARVLVSAHSDVKRAVSLLADQDGSYGKCVVQFAKGCKRSEAAYMQVGKILDKYIANQVRIQPTADLCHVSLCGSGANRASSCTDQS